MNTRCLPALKNLRELVFAQQSAQSFTAAFAAALKSLTKLSLDLKGCARLPSSISQITTLQVLDLVKFNEMVLQESDIAIIAALPELRRLDLASAPTDVAVALRFKLPQLRLEVVGMD